MLCCCRTDGFGRSQKLWGADAEQFKPERWLSMSEAPSQYKFIAFNAGFRLCLGKSVAITEASLVLAQIVRKVTVKACASRNLLCTRC